MYKVSHLHKKVISAHGVIGQKVLPLITLTKNYQLRVIGNKSICVRCKHRRMNMRIMLVRVTSRNIYLKPLHDICHASHNLLHITLPYSIIMVWMLFTPVVTKLVQDTLRKIDLIKKIVCFYTGEENPVSQRLAHEYVGVENYPIDIAAHTTPS